MHGQLVGGRRAILASVLIHRVYMKYTEEHTSTRLLNETCQKSQEVSGFLINY